ncbi:hypothetical protein [Burkholderia cenocepacia]|uniref:hypothetical protein n=1 Tax=Burkholderia cenocepacia TaxID=95486 RepID=UPI001B969BC2|nr:hypothetical protein [Burkholderia cenocepacia]MBR8403218.1 hypothetical protein [Burkholderia cenocepacia]
MQALNPAREPYRAILLQPSGVIEANEARVGHADAALGHALCSGFVSTAAQAHADLAIAPEYCVPWSVVDEIIGGRHRPPVGALWVLGCESIPPAEILALAERCNAGGQCLFHHEPLDPRQVAQRRYVDPLLYVFWVQDADGQNLLFLLVQFKTVACRDYRDIEQTSLCLGQSVYAFNRGIGRMSLLSIICSDAFDFTPHVDQAHLNCLLIHIQLNPKPAHIDYAAYRARLCAVGTNNHVELLCVNWAQNVKEKKGEGKFVEWKNIAGSAWYAPPAKFGADDGLIDELHRRGLYYSLLAQRWHAFFLNYEGQILQLQKQKLLFPGEQAIVPKNFVAVEERWTWNFVMNAWERGAIANDGFAVALTSYQAIAGSLQQAAHASPLAVERAIEILVGPRGNPTSWYAVNELDAFQLDRDEESIRRVTVHQEHEPTRPGVAYRRKRLQRAHDAIGLVQSDVPWPVPVRDLAEGFHFAWRKETPHHNVAPAAGGRGPAALVYLADQADDAEIDSVHQKLKQAIISHALTVAVREGKGGEELADVVVRAQDRLCVVFRRDNRYGARGPQGTNLIDIPAGASPVDFTEDRS